MRLVVAVAVVALLGSCTGSSGPDDEVPAASVSPTESVIETPTEVSVPEVPDQARIDAAVAELDAAIAAGQGPEGAIAYDLLGTSVREDGSVTLTICSWTGETVFDDVRDSLYRTAVDPDREVTATHVTSPIAADDCVNSTLIESAFDFIDAFDTYSADVSADPETFATDERSDRLLTESYYERLSASTERWRSEEIYYETSATPGDIRGDLQADVLFRRYLFESSGLLELVVCRPMNAAYGIYRDGVLIDDEGRDSGPGDHSIAMYQLEVDPGSELLWRVAGDQNLIWADCFETGDWPGAANHWRPRDIALEVLPG